MFNETAYDLAIGAGCSQDGARIAAAIAQAESSGNARAYNPETAANTPSGQGSYGLWQIYRKAHPEFAGQDLYNPATNAAAMFSVSGGCQNWNPWSTFKNGAYRNYLQASPVGSGPSTGNDSGAGGALPTPDEEGGLETSGNGVDIFPGIPSWLPIAGAALAAYFLLR